MQWPNVFSVKPTNDYSSRCFPDRVGSSLQRVSNNRAMVRGGENLLHKCAGTTSNIIGSISLQQIEQGKAIHFQIDNKAALTYLSKMRLTRHKHMITAEYLSSVLNTIRDKESKKKTWLLYPKIFQAVSWLLVLRQ